MTCQIQIVDFFPDDFSSCVPSQTLLSRFGQGIDFAYQFEQSFRILLNSSPFTKRHPRPPDLQFLVQSNA
jgi:hypothetical protein